MWQIIDANINRLREGLRVLEDIARFYLSDQAIFRRIRRLRHELKGLGYDEKCLLLRNVSQDIGADEKSPQHHDIISLARSNAVRCQEALRVLEECSRIPELCLEGGFFKSARFELYQIERELIFSLKRKEKSGKIKGLYVILDTQLLKEWDEIEVARRIIKGGARVIQLRDKRREKGELLYLSIKLKEICHESGLLFIINDHLDIALLSGADGLHLGQKDIPLSYARRLLPDKIIGVSVHNIDEAEKAWADGADYISAGSVFFTKTKKDAVVIGVEALRGIVQKSPVPVVAIGGINKDNIGLVRGVGVKAVAVASAVLCAGDIEAACRQLSSSIENEQAY